MRIPSLSDVTSETEFLIDTGAAISVVRSVVIADLGISSDFLLEMPRESNIGAGGAVVHAVWPGELEVSHEDGRRDVQTLALRLPLSVAIGEDDVPSVLGMNFLDVYRLVVSVPEGRVELQTPFS